MAGGHGVGSSTHCPGTEHLWNWHQENGLIRLENTTRLTANRHLYVESQSILEYEYKHLFLQAPFSRVLEGAYWIFWALRQRCFLRHVDG